MAMAHAVQQEADKTPGKEARAMEGFATALRQVRHFLTPSYLRLNTVLLPIGVTYRASNTEYRISFLISVISPSLSL